MHKDFTRIDIAYLLYFILFAYSFDHNVLLIWKIAILIILIVVIIIIIIIVT